MRWAGDADGDVTGLRQDEFFDFDGDAVWLEFAQHHFGHIDGQRFDQFPASASAKPRKPHGHGVVVDCSAEAIIPGARGKIMVEFDSDEKALRFAPLGFGHAHPQEDFQFIDDNLVHNLASV
jgi:hypothetical protein